MFKRKNVYFVLIVMLLLVTWYIVNFQKSPYEKITDYLPTTDFNEDSLQMINISDQRKIAIIWGDGKDRDWIYTFDFHENEIQSSKPITRTLPEDRPLLWSRRMYDGDKSLVQGVFDPTKIDSVHVENYEVEYYIQIHETLTLFLSVEFYDKTPVNIKGFLNDGEIIYSSLPLNRQH